MSKTPFAPYSSSPKKINLALQGGGSHGAFTWGVLDYLLEDGRLEFEAISATSAGSMNAVIMLQGLLKGGRQEARAHLDKFWERVSDAGEVFSPVPPSGTNPFAAFLPKWASVENSALQFFNIMSQNLSPYQFNPMNYNPLRDILDDMVDFRALQQNCPKKLFITATNVRTGDARIFTGPELTRDMVLASAALPNIFQAVTIDGQAYWDGGYVGNPSLWPLCYDVGSHDILIIHVNPLIREGVPEDALSIEERLNEVTFNSALLKELRAIAFVQKLIKNDMLKEKAKPQYREILLHAVRAEKTMSKLGISSKLDTSEHFLHSLKKAGRSEAKAWLAAAFDHIGVSSTVDIDRDYLNMVAKTTK